MPRSEFEPPFSQWNASPPEQLRRLSELYDIPGLEITTNREQPWFCERTERGVRLSLNPNQPLACGFLNVQRSPDAISASDNSLYVMGHVLGHVWDCLDPDWVPPGNDEPAMNFFHHMIDDLAIDTQSRAIPLIDSLADSMYAVNAGDMTMLPLNVQLMYGLRHTAVTGGENLQVDESIKTIINTIKQYKKNGTQFDALQLISDADITYSQRHVIAREIILPYYLALLEPDAAFALPDAGNEDGAEYGGEGTETEPSESEPEDNENQNGGTENETNSNSMDSDSSENSGLQKDEYKAEAESEMTNDSTEGSTDDADSSPSEAAELEDTDKPSDQLEEEADDQREERCEQLAGIVAEEMRLRPGDARLYAEALYEWDSVIKDVANIFLELATATDRYCAPRYSRDAHTMGVKLHPHTLSQVALQLETGDEQAIWQSVVREKPRQEYQFGGMDIHFLVDVTASMWGEKGKCAAATALCLIEGLQLARHKASYNQQFSQPDVKTQIIAFGSDTEILSPLSYLPQSEHKGKAFVNVLYPISRATLVNGALERVREDAALASNRQAIVIIVSDSEFGDQEAALETVESLPNTAYVTQLVVNSNEYEAIGHHHRRVADPAHLPAQLFAVLSDYMKNNS